MSETGATRDESTASGRTRRPSPIHGTTLFQPGDLLAARYRVVRFIARGGMGEVYEAEDLELDVRVAVKTIRAERAGDPLGVERLKREILAARRVSHPNVVRLHDLCFHILADQREVAFITMDLLAGETLDEYLRHAGPLSAADAAPFVAQLAAALEAAHAVDVVHRDFKSQNVILVSAPGERGPRLVVTDFGLAKADVDLHGALAITTELAGTPAYMAPEQVSRRHPVTRAADIYALGIVMFEMVTGQRPFMAETALATAVRRLAEPPPSPRQYAPDLPASWEAAILRCLALEPSARFARARDVVAALGSSPPRHHTSRRRHGTIAALVATAVAAAAIVAWPRPGDGDDARIGQPSTVPRGETIVIRHGSSQCLGVDGDASFNGTKLQQRSCSGSSGQSFRLEEHDNGTYRLVNVGSSLCLDVHAGGQINGSDLELWMCDGTAWQSFRLEAMRDGTVRLRNLGSDKCVDVPAGSAAEGANVQVWTCSGSGTQRWGLLPAEIAVQASRASARIDLSLARVLSQVGLRDASRPAIVRALTRARRIEDHALTAEALLFFARVEAEHGELATAEDALLDAVTEAEQASAADLRVDAWIQLGDVLRRLGRPRDAARMLALAAGARRPSADPPEVATSARRDLALGRPVTQSSTSWEVDLGSIAWVDSIDIVQRIGGSAEGLDFYVMVSPRNFGSTAHDLSQEQVDVYRVHQTGEPRQTSHHITIQRPGRWVRVQLAAAGALPLAGVAVWGRPNLALGKKATQTGVYHGAGPERAVDGNTDGFYNNGSVSHTADDRPPSWWQLDLGPGVESIGTVVLFNRTDCCAERLGHFKIHISDLPLARDAKGRAVPDATTWTKHVQHTGGARWYTISVGRSGGRYLLIEPDQPTVLSLAEVLVFGE